MQERRVFMAKRSGIDQTHATHLIHEHAMGSGKGLFGSTWHFPRIQNGSSLFSIRKYSTACPLIPVIGNP